MRKIFTKLFVFAVLSTIVACTMFLNCAALALVSKAALATAACLLTRLKAVGQLVSEITSSTTIVAGIRLDKVYLFS